MKLNAQTAVLLDERFGHDTLIALATADANHPSVRAVNACYEDGVFYVITDARSAKMQQIAGGFFCECPKRSAHQSMPSSRNISTRLRASSGRDFASVQSCLRKAPARSFPRG